MSKQPKEYLKHILIEIEFLLDQSVDLELTELMKDEVKNRAFARSIQIIGEAAKKIPEEFRLEHPEIEWKEMTGMRDRIVHDYMGVDYEIIWDVIENELPSLKEKLLKIFE